MHNHYGYIPLEIKYNYNNNVNSILEPYHKNKKIFALIFFSTSFINILSLVFPLSLLQMYDRILPNKSISTLLLIVGAVITAITLETVLRILRSMISLWFDTKSQHKAAIIVFKHILGMPLREHERLSSGAQLERINAINTLKDFHHGQVLITLFDLPFVLLFIALIAILSGWLVLVPIATSLIIGARTLIKAKGLYEAIEKKRLSDEIKVNYLIEVLGGLHCVKSMAMEAQMVRRYERLQLSNVKCNSNIADKTANTMRFLAISSQVSVAAVAIVGAILVINNQISIGILAACILLSGRCISPLNKIVMVWNRLQAIKITEKKITNILSLPQEIQFGVYKPLTNLQGKIEFNNVSFRYNEQAPYLFENTSFVIQPNETIAIKADSACGKTTLLKLLLCIIPPESGVIKLDDLKLSAYRPRDVREKIAYIPHDGVLLDGTILENITKFRGAEYEDKAKSITKQIGAYQQIVQLPHGFDTQVGYSVHNNISVGLSQLIVIARALLDEPKIILFDDGNKGVDAESDNILKNCFAELRGSCTMILISYRPSFLKIADKWLTLRNRKLKWLQKVQ